MPTDSSTSDADDGSTDLRNFARVASGYWSGDKRREAWALTLGALALALVTLAVQIGVNRWHRFFFDALERKDAAALTQGLLIIVALVAAAAATAVLFVHARMRLQLRWRQWLTGRLAGDWLAERRFYQLTIGDDRGSNPEYRIADDARMATEPMVDFLIGLTNAMLMAVAFLGVLWSIGGVLEVGVGGSTLRIPGYLVFAAILYALTASGLTYFIGRPLIRAADAKNGAEAKLRYELTRVRENAETIAMIGGDDQEKARIEASFRLLARRWLAVIRNHARMTWVINANAVLAPVAPLLLGAPAYLNGSMSLGMLMQAAAAFVQVQLALNWLVDNAIRLAEWRAAAERVGQLIDAFDELDDTVLRNRAGSIVLSDSPDDKLRIENLSIAHSNGDIIIAEAHVVFAPGEKILVKGESGAGKSTLIRAMAGLWPWGSGEILRPRGARVAFLPQRPYIPDGSLRQALQYPGGRPALSDAALKDALNKCGLERLCNDLEAQAQWRKILSGGEQQRLAFARLIVDPPDIVIMDEATSALDEESQTRLMSYFKGELARSTVLSVGHRRGLEQFHSREIMLVRKAGGRACFARHKTYYKQFRLANFLEKRLRL